MEIALDNAVPPEVAEAVRRAAERAGLERERHRATGRGAWWRDGVADAVDRTTLVLNHHKRSAPAAAGEPSG